MKKQSKTCFIIWAPYCKRADILSQFMNCDPVFINSLIKGRGYIWYLFFWIDYLFKSTQTLRYLFKYKPDIVFAQSPPSFCPMVCWIYCKLYKKKLVVDAHNSAFEPPWVNIPMFFSVLKSASAVIIHNYELESFLKNKYSSIKFHTLHDKIPDFDFPEKSVFQKYILFIVSFSNDEPIEEALGAFENICKYANLNIQFKITGNFKKNLTLYKRFEKVRGIEFLGYIDEDRYLDILNNAFGVITLSKRRMVQLCASVESIGVNIPLIISDSKTNRRLFSKGAIFAKSDVSAIQKAIYSFIDKREELYSEIFEVRQQWETNWTDEYNELEKKIK